jgi:hypothetical protein
MIDPLPLSLAGFLLVWGAGFWLFLLLYNVGICRMDRSFLKGLLKRVNALVFLIAPPALLLAFRGAPWVEEVLSFSPRSALSRSLLGAAGGIWAFALACQAAISWEILRPPSVRHLVSRRSKRAPYDPAPEDWDLLRAPSPEVSADGRQASPPPCRRRVRPARIPRVLQRIVLSQLYRSIDQSYDLRVVEIVLCLPALPAAFNGLRLLHLTDLHYGALLSPGYFRHVVRESQQQRPDLVLVSGDFTADDNLYRESVEILSPLKPPMGAWCIRGNHDHATEPHVLAYWLEHYGVRLLANASADFVRDGAVLRLIGVEHPFFPLRDWQSVMGAETRGELFRLVISHTPDNAGRLASLGADLILSGHTHGGQWRLPLLGPAVVPSVFGRRLACGLRPVGDAILYASPGIGVHTIPLRLNCPPEITLFELRSLTQAGSASR